MAKYIDAEKLRAEIDRLLKVNTPYESEGYRFGLLDLRSFLDSLQQEQPEVDLDEETETWISTHIKVETSGIHQVDTDELAKAVKEWGKAIAHHFYELARQKYEK